MSGPARPGNSLPPTVYAAVRAATSECRRQANEKRNSMNLSKSGRLRGGGLGHAGSDAALYSRAFRDLVAVSLTASVLD
jgi:hypothetical protein